MVSIPGRQSPVLSVSQLFSGRLRSWDFEKLEFPERSFISNTGNPNHALLLLLIRL